MPEITPDPHDATLQDTGAVLRAKATEKIHEIADRAKAALRDKGINFHVFFLVPSAGKAIVIIGTTHEPDPSDHEWDFASGIAKRIVAEVLELDVLRLNGIACSVAHPSTVVRGGDNAAG